MIIPNYPLQYPYPLPIHSSSFEFSMNENRTHKCPDCGGDGEHVGSHRSRCITCNGKGVLSDREYNAYMTKQKETTIRDELVNKVRYKLYRLSNEQLEAILQLPETR